MATQSKNNPYRPPLRLKNTKNQYHVVSFKGTFDKVCNVQNRKKTHLLYNIEKDTIKPVTNKKKYNSYFKNEVIFINRIN